MENENKDDLLYIPPFLRRTISTAPSESAAHAATPHTVVEEQAPVKKRRPAPGPRKVSCGRRGSKTKVERSTREANDLVRQQLLALDYSAGFVANVPITIAKNLVNRIVSGEGATPEHLVTWKGKK
jgi:hypothetical protein